MNLFLCYNIYIMNKIIRRKSLFFIGIILCCIIIPICIYISSSKSGLPILMYHAVYDEEKGEEPYGDYSLFVEKKEFEKQMNHLKSVGYTPIFLSEIDKNKYEKPIVITFDDGYENVYTNAYEVLKRIGFKFNFFIISGWLGDPYVTSEQLKELSNGEYVEIGSHTVSHVKLDELDYKEQEKQLKESKEILEKLLNKKINTIAYPYGSYNKDTLKIVSKYYDYAVSTKPGLNGKNKNNYKLKRYNIPSDMSLDEFKKILN